jgi:hypothetical protein
MSELPTRPFDYSNLSPRPAGAFYRAAAGVLPGVRKVQAQIVPYALAWQHANLAALRATGPLWVALGDSMSQGIGASAYDRGRVGVLGRRFGRSAIRTGSSTCRSAARGRLTSWTGSCRRWSTWASSRTWSQS